MPDEHYYTAAPSSSRQPQEFSATLRGFRFLLATDAGVFSRGGIDRGTALLIEALAVPPEAGVLVDLGCGYGPIGLTLAALAPQARVYLVDPNGRACELARTNANRNGLANVTVIQGEGLAGVPGTPDLIATNPPVRAGKRVVYGLMAEAAARLRSGGELWTVIRTNQGALSLAKELQVLFPAVEEAEKGGGYRVYRARR